jgi:hypothetical protein
MGRRYNLPSRQVVYKTVFKIGSREKQTTHQTTSTLRTLIVNDDHYRDAASTLPVQDSELASVPKGDFVFPLALESIRLGVASYTAATEYRFHSPSLSAERKECAHLHLYPKSLLGEWMIRILSEARDPA